MSSLTKQNLAEMYRDAFAALKAVSRNRTASHTRVALWNSFFPDSPLSLSSSLRHIMTRSFHQFVSGGPTDRFCFELSVLFFDLPIQFNELTSIFPIPLSIAMRDAYKVVNQHLEKPNQESVLKLINLIFESLPKEKLPVFKATLQSIFWDKSNVDQYIEVMKKILEPACFDAFLEAMPPTYRIRYALLYDRPPPKVIIDYQNLEMPLEFIQAIAEIDSTKALSSLVLTENLEDIISNYKESDSDLSDLSSSSEDEKPHQKSKKNQESKPEITKQPSNQ